MPEGVEMLASLLRCKHVSSSDTCLHLSCSGLHCLLVVLHGPEGCAAARPNSSHLADLPHWDASDMQLQLRKHLKAFRHTKTHYSSATETSMLLWQSVFAPQHSVTQRQNKSSSLPSETFPRYACKSQPGSRPLWQLQQLQGTQMKVSKARCVLCSANPKFR
jgi:hypothetical protein